MKYLSIISCDRQDSAIVYFVDKSFLQVREKVIEYTYCEKVDEPGNKCDEYLEENSQNLSSVTCKCKLLVELTDDIEKQVYLYYGLSNFYQVTPESSLEFVLYSHWITVR